MLRERESRHIGYDTRLGSVLQAAMLDRETGLTTIRASRDETIERESQRTVERGSARQIPFKLHVTCDEFQQIIARLDRLPAPQTLPNSADAMLEDSVPGRCAWSLRITAALIVALVRSVSKPSSSSSSSVSPFSSSPFSAVSAASRDGSGLQCRSSE